MRKKYENKCKVANNNENKYTTLYYGLAKRKIT